MILTGRHAEVQLKQRLRFNLMTSDLSVALPCLCIPPIPPPTPEWPVLYRIWDFLGFSLPFPFIFILTAHLGMKVLFVFLFVVFLLEPTQVFLSASVKIEFKITNHNLFLLLITHISCAASVRVQDS